MEHEALHTSKGGLIVKCGESEYEYIQFTSQVVEKDCKQQV